MNVTSFSCCFLLHAVERILDLNSRTFFVPCGNHSLNLVIKDAALSCTLAVDFFSNIQEVYNFFSASTYRWSILKKHSPTLTVKPHSSTRWESRIEAILPLRYYPEEIYDAVYEASQDESIDAFGRNTALGIARKLQSFKFLCCVVTWHEILFKVNIVSKMLQKITSDLQSSMNLIKSVQGFLENMRSDNGVNGVITDAKELADKLGVDAEFEKEIKVRSRKMKKKFSYESEDEPITDAKRSFKVNFFYVVLDKAIITLKERFQLMENHSKNFEFLYQIDNLRIWDKDDLKKACENLETVLRDEEECDIDGKDLFNELQIFAPMLTSGTTPAEVLSFITKNGFVDSFPNVFVSLRILLTLPVSVASGERSFSKLKLIKTYLRSTISQERLNGLALIAIENDILNELDTDTVIKDFAKLKSRKVSF